MNLVRSILREKEGSTVNEWEDWSSIFISRKDSTSSKNEQEKAYCLGRIDGCSPMAKALPASCRLNSLLFRFRVVFFGVRFFFATSTNEVLGYLKGGRKISTHFIHSVPTARRDPQQTKATKLLAVALF